MTDGKTSQLSCLALYWAPTPLPEQKDVDGQDKPGHDG